MAIGLGAYREEFEAWVGNRYPSPHRGDMMEEGLAIFRSLITDKVSSFDGKYYSYKNIEMFPEAEAESVSAVHRRAQHEGGRARRGDRSEAGCPDGVRSTRSRSASRRSHAIAEAAGRNPKDIEVAPQFSLLIGKTQEAGGRDLHEERAGGAPRIARPHRPRPGISGDRQPGRIAANDHREDSSAQSDGRRSLLGDGASRSTRRPSFSSSFTGSPRRSCRTSSERPNLRGELLPNALTCSR